jgi:HemY protein
LERSKGALDKAVYRRQRAVLLTARALALEETDRDNAKASALEAVKLAPTLVPAAALAGRMLAEGGELRKASRMVAKAWRANPHPELAQTYAELRFGDAARDRLNRIEALVKKTPGHVESALAVARAAIDAREFGRARAVLAPYLSAPTKRVALLMAELERADHNDEGRAREWVARALHAAPDPQWTADGHVSDRWLPISPVSGRLDAFEWRVPVTGMISAPVIEPEPLAETSEEAKVEPEDAASRPPELESAPPAREGRPSTPARAAAPSARRSVRRTTPPKVEPVIPLVHAPDDPGPEDVEENEPLPAPQNGGWRKILE